MNKKKEETLSKFLPTKYNIKTLKYQGGQYGTEKNV